MADGSRFVIQVAASRILGGEAIQRRTARRIIKQGEKAVIRPEQVSCRRRDDVVVEVLGESGGHHLERRLPKVLLKMADHL